MRTCEDDNCVIRAGFIFHRRLKLPCRLILSARITTSQAFNDTVERSLIEITGFQFFFCVLLLDRSSSLCWCHKLYIYRLFHFNLTPNLSRKILRQSSFEFKEDFRVRTGTFKKICFSRAHCKMAALNCPTCFYFSRENTTFFLTKIFVREKLETFVGTMPCSGKTQKSKFFVRSRKKNYLFLVFFFFNNVSKVSRSNR